MRSWPSTSASSRASRRSSSRTRLGAAAPTVGLPTEKPWEAAGRPGAYDPHERLKDMDIDQVDAEVLYATPPGGAEFYTLDADACLAAFQATNDTAIEFASVDPEPIDPGVHPPARTTSSSALKEVQRIANEGARAVQLPLYPSDVELAPYWDEVYDPLWSAIEDARHPDQPAHRRQPVPVRAHGPRPHAVRRASSSRCRRCHGRGDRELVAPGHLRALTHGSQVGFVEAGLGGCPTSSSRLDTHVRSSRVGAARHEPARAAEPLLAPEHVRHLRGGRVRRANRHEIGVENLLWATDYPHPDCTWPESPQVIHTHFDDVPVDEMRLMVGGNAARIYRL